MSRRFVPNTKTSDLQHFCFTSDFSGYAIETSLVQV